MPSVFPGALDNIASNKLNSTVSATDHPDHHNLLADAVNAIEATLGAGLSNIVTSVDVSGGTTGLTTSGGPITSSGTITLAGLLNPASGGTGVNNGTRTLTLASSGGWGGTITWQLPFLNLTVFDNAEVSGINSGNVSLATDSGLEFAGLNPQQFLRLGTPTTITSLSTNSVTTDTHTHAITANVRLLGNGTAQYQIPVTGASPFVPAYVTATGTGAPVLAASPSLTGSVGINQPSPATALDVVGSATISTGLNIGTATGALVGQVSQRASVGTLANILENTSTSVNVTAGFVFRLDNQNSQQVMRLVYAKNTAGAGTGTGTLGFRKQSADGSTALDLMQINGTNDVIFLAGFSAGTPDAYGKVGIYTTAPTYDLSFGTAANRTIGINASTVIAGRALTIKSGDTSGGNNLAAGSLFLESGTGTGSGASNIIFRTAVPEAVATDTQTVTERMRVTNGGDVGIGTNSPSAQARLHIDKDIAPTLTGVVNGFFADIGVTGHSSGGTDARTFNLLLTTTGANNVTSEWGAFVNASNNLDATKVITNHYAYGASPRITGAGGSTAMGGFFVEPVFPATATGTVTNYFGFRSNDWNYAVGATSTITNAYGLYLEGLYNATYSTNAYGVYQAGASDDNYFAGNVGIGDTTPTSALTFGDGKNIEVATTTGTKIGTATTQKIGFYNATPVVRPSAYTQTYATADKTMAARTAAALTNNTGGTVSTTLAAITAGATYTQADMTAVKNALASLADQMNKSRTDSLDIADVVNAVIDDLQALGLVG